MGKKFRTLAVIPARQGSKSLKNKNIKLLNGKPLLCYSIEYSLKSNLIDKTVVSTDSEHYANISKQCGADVPFLRPEDISGDDVQDYPVIKHALDFFDSKGEFYDLVVLLRPTSPLRPSGLIEKAYEIFEKNPDTSSVRSVTKIKEHPFRAWEMTNDRTIVGYERGVYEPYNLPRQVLPELYFQTGDIEVISRETLINGSVSGTKIRPIVINYSEMIDIDDASDFLAAEKYVIQN